MTIKEAVVVITKKENKEAKPVILFLVESYDEDTGDYWTGIRLARTTNPTFHRESIDSLHFALVADGGDTHDTILIEDPKDIQKYKLVEDLIK